MTDRDKKPTLYDHHEEPTMLVAMALALLGPSEFGAHFWAVLHSKVLVALRQARREGELAMLTKVEERLKDLTTDAGGQPIYIGTQWKAVGLQDAIRYHLFQLRRAPDQESQG